MECEIDYHSPQLVDIQWWLSYGGHALEAELRRRGEGEREVGSGGVAGVVPPPADDGRIDKSEAIEIQLRQRALQSLLAKRKEQEH